jgi:hypothetical protein
MTFADQERQAFELGRRMSEAKFSLQDNPFERVSPRLAVQWQHGFSASHALQNLSAGLARGALSTKRRHLRLINVA